MKFKVNGGIYGIDLKGNLDCEFDGVHPSIIIQNLKEKEMYYIIPLTTYTKDRWEKLRRAYCCKIESTNSIARVDKMQIRHLSCIPDKYFSKGKLLIPTPEEIENVYEHLLKYIQFSLELSKRDYFKFVEQYINVYEHFEDLFNKNLISFSENAFIKININNEVEEIKITSDLTNYSNLSFTDIKYLVWSFIGKKGVHIKYDKKTNILIILIEKSNTKFLTIKETYDKLNVQKGE